MGNCGEPLKINLRGRVPAIHAACRNSDLLSTLKVCIDYDSLLHECGGKSLQNSLAHPLHRETDHFRRGFQSVIRLAEFPVPSADREQI